MPWNSGKIPDTCHKFRERGQQVSFLENPSGGTAKATAAKPLIDPVWVEGQAHDVDAGTERMGLVELLRSGQSFPQTLKLQDVERVQARAILQAWKVQGQ